MAIIYSYPTVVPTPDDLVLGTDVNRADKPTKNFTIQSIVDIVAGGAAGLGAVLKISSNAQDTSVTPPANQPIQNLTFINGTGSATFSSFKDGTMTIQNGTGTDFVSITSLDFLGNLTGIVKVGSSIAGAADGVVGNNVTAVTQPLGTDNTTIATTEFVQQELTGSDLDFRGDATGTIGSVDLDSETFAVVGTALNIETSTTAGGQVLTLKLTDDVTIADDLTVTDVLTVNGTTASNIIEGGLQVNNSGGTHSFRVKGQTNDNLINTNYGDTDAKDQVAIGKNLAIDGTRLDVSGLIQGTSIKSSGMLTAQAAFSLTGGINLPSGYGLVNQVLTNVASPGATTSLVWTTPTVGTLTDVDPGFGIAIDKTAPAEPVIAIDYLGTNNAIIKATAYDKAADPIIVAEDEIWFNDKNTNAGTPVLINKIKKAKFSDLPFIPAVSGTQYDLAMFSNAAGTELADSIISQDSGSSAATVTGTLTITGNSSGPKFIVDTSEADADFQGTASEALELAVAGDISSVNDVISYPGTSGTVKVQAAAGVAVEFQDGVGENSSIVYPVIGQVVTGTSIVAGTKVASVSGSTLVLDTATSAALVAGATLNFAASTLDIYTSGGNVRMPSFIPSTVATSKYLTNLPTPTSSEILSTDTILSGMAKLQGQITATTGLAYEGTWAASVSAVSDGSVTVSTDLEIVTGDDNIVVGTVVEGDGIPVSDVVRVSVVTNNTTFVLDTAISIATATALTMSPPGGFITGETAGTPAATLTTAANKVNGHFYICNTIGKAEPNAAVPWAAATTPNEWAVGDWVIYVSNGTASDGWQKLDMTSDITGTGAANKIAKWTSPNTLSTGLISDDGSTVTIGASGTGDFLVEGGTTLGGGVTNTSTATGPFTANKNIIINEGIRLGASDYGTTAKALFSGGAQASVNTWTEVKWTISDGTNTSDIANAGTATFASGVGVINTESSGTVTTALRYEDVNVDPATGALNFVDAAATSTTPVASDFILFSDQDTATKTSVKKTLISNLPLDEYSKWILRGDNYAAGTAATSQDVDSEEVMTVAGGTIIDTVVGATRKVTINHGDLTVTQTDNTGTPLTPAFGGAIELVASASGTGQGHMDTVVTNEITLPSPVNFTAGTAPGAGTPAAGTAGYVPAPAAGTGSTAYFLNGTGTMTIPPNDDGVTAVTATAPISSTGGDTPNITHDTSGVTSGTYDTVTVDNKGHVTAGVQHNGGRKSVLIEINSSAMSTSSWVDMFTIHASQGITIISTLMASGGKYGSITKGQALSCHVAQQGGAVGTTTANDPVSNKIIDTGPGADGGFELQFLPYGAGSNSFGYKCQAKSTTATQDINISVEIMEGTSRQVIGSNYPVITDLT